MAEFDGTILEWGYKYRFTANLASWLELKLNKNYLKKPDLKLGFRYRIRKG